MPGYEAVGSLGTDRVVNVPWDLDDLLKMSSPACPGSSAWVSPCWSGGIWQDVCGGP